jgi:hypothetical protein
MPVLPRSLADAEEQLIVLQTPEPAELDEVTRVVAGVGGQISQVYGPRVLLAQIPQTQRETFHAAIERTRSLSAEPAAAAPFPLTEGERLGVDGWSLRNSLEFTEAKAIRRGRGDTWGEEPPDAGDEDDLAAPEAEMGAPPPDMSPYLIGSVAVGIIIVEGPTPSVQFSTAERVKVVAEVQDGLGWLAAQEPLAKVTWVFDVHVVRVTVAPDPTLPNTYEAREAPWRNEAMAMLGFSASFQGVHDYVSALRQRMGTQWGYVGFFTKYPIKHFAYASKPRVVMHYDNNGWTPDNIAEVFTHETGHIFGCPDEYRQSGCTCTSRHGHLQEVNGNCEGCAAPFVPCLMAANTRALCTYTRVHLGWRDSNGDGVLDPLG